MNATLEYALRYLKKGFSLIPLCPRDKKPRIPWEEFQERYATANELQKWFGNGSRNNIGIVTGRISGITVLDLDTSDAVSYAKTNNFPKTPMQCTGKGYHLFYKYKEGTRNFQKRDDLPGIDLRSDGGYIVAAPSVHPSGKQYAFKEGYTLDDLPLVELPEIILAKKQEGKKPISKLYKGTTEGNRNDTLARLSGSWVNDGLTLEECMENAALWNSKNHPPLPQREVEQTVRSVFDRHYKEKTSKESSVSINTQKLNLTKLSDLLSEPEEKISWIVEGLLPAGGFSVVGAKPKAGKSTLARNLALSVARGEPFLGLKTLKGLVIYLALEEKRSEVRKHFHDMGATGEEEIYTHIASAPVDGLAQLAQIAEVKKPSLIIIDPLFRFTRVRDSNDYAIVTGALEPVLILARESGAHVMCLHHSSKIERAGGDGLLGSTAIFGSVDTGIFMRRTEKYRSMNTIQRYGEDMPETVLVFDNEKRTICLGGSREDEEVKQVEQAIIEFLNNQIEPSTEPEINEAVEGSNAHKRKALRDLAKNNVVKRQGEGKRGNPYKYFIDVSCTLVPSIYSGQENENAKHEEFPCKTRQDSCPEELTKNTSSKDLHGQEKAITVEKNWEYVA